MAVIQKPDDPDEVFLQVRGFDCYDPATGSLRWREQGNIACWMIEHRAQRPRLLRAPDRLPEPWRRSPAPAGATRACEPHRPGSVEGHDERYVTAVSLAEACERRSSHHYGVR